MEHTGILVDRNWVWAGPGWWLGPYPPPPRLKWRWDLRLEEWYRVRRPPSPLPGTTKTRHQVWCCGTPADMRGRSWIWSGRVTTGPGGSSVFWPTGCSQGSCDLSTPGTEVWSPLTNVATPKEPTSLLVTLCYQYHSSFGRGQPPGEESVGV